MSTRSIIAIPHLTRKWQGVYHHSDGYPKGIGKELVRLFNEHGYEWCAKLVTDHPAGWSCLMEYDSQWAKDGHHYPECYCHSERFLHDRNDMTTYGDDPAYEEYLYLITPKGVEAYDTHKNKLVRLHDSTMR